MKGRILFIAESILTSKGGAEISSRELIEHLEESYIVDLVTNSSCPICCNEYLKFGHRAIKLIPSTCYSCSKILNKFFNYYSVFRFQVFFRVFKYLSKNRTKYDLIVFGNLSHYLSSSVILAAKLLGFKTMIIYRDFNFLTSGKIESVSSILSFRRIFSFQLWNPLKILINRFINNSSDFNVCISNMQKEVFETFRFRIDKVQYNYVSSRDIPIDSQVETSFDYDFCYIGRYSRLKGVDLLIEEWLHLYKANLRFKIFFAGFENSSIPSRLLNEIENTHQAHNYIHFLGWKSQDEIVRLLSKTRVLVYPSIYLDSFGRSIINGLSIGKITLVSSYTGASELLNSKLPELIIDESNIRDKMLYSMNNFKDLSERVHLNRDFFENFTLPKGRSNYYSKMIHERFCI